MVKKLKENLLYLVLSVAMLSSLCLFIIWGNMHLSPQMIDVNMVSNEYISNFAKQGNISFDQAKDIITNTEDSNSEDTSDQTEYN